MHLLEIAEIQSKIASLDQSVGAALNAPSPKCVPAIPARDVPVVSAVRLPSRPKLSQPEGRSYLIHALANIELQAVELNLRTLHEYPGADPRFRRELADLTLEEGKHLQMCLDCLVAKGGFWGQFQVHLHLWDAVKCSDVLLDRVFKVHCYLEGSGLDSGGAILQRLSGVGDKAVITLVDRIVSDEVRHVEFGLRWFRRLCAEQGIDPRQYLATVYPRLRMEVPRREKMDFSLRSAAGFTQDEIQFMSEV
jgi:uncharacterized ferritin-like protein (DUF455 family)